MRRATQTRLEAALAQLYYSEGLAMRGAGTDLGPIADPAGGRAGGRAGLEDLLDNLESAAEQASARLHDGEILLGRLQAALDLVGEGIVICDERGDEVYRNAPAARHLTGRLGEVLAEQAVQELLAGACLGHQGERLLELFAPTRRNLAVRAFRLVGADGPLGAVAVVEDVSERRRIDAMRRDFVANVSHELKTPVGALSLLAETLDGEEDAETVARLAMHVGTEAERLGRLIDDLLDLSRIEVNENDAQEIIPLDGLIAIAIDPLRALAHSHDIGLLVDVPPFGAVVRGDRRDLVSAIGNLVDNAIKYSESGSKVEVRTREDGEWIVIEVRDQGIGIPARDRQRIFERFYRVDRARSRLTGGTGLGLSIVRHVAANHGGTVSVESTEGEGSTFMLRLPKPAGAVISEPPSA